MLSFQKAAARNHSGTDQLHNRDFLFTLAQIHFFHSLRRAWLLLSLLAALPLAAATESGTPPRRILSTTTAGTALLIELGAAGELAAIDRYGKIVPGSEHAAEVGRGSALSAERVLLLEIDLAVIWYYQHSLQSLFRRMNIPTFIVPPLRCDNYPDVVEALGKRIGRAEKAAEIAARFRRLIRELEQNAPARRTRVYLELYSPCRSAGNESYAGDLLRLSGGENVVSSLQRSGTVSAEAIIHGDPEVIFVVDGFTSPDELARRSGWGEISAVRNRRVFTIDRKYLVPGYDPAGAIREMSRHLHSPRKQ